MNFRLKLCPQECTYDFSKIWPSNLIFDPTGPNSEPDLDINLDIMMINFLT